MKKGQEKRIWTPEEKAEIVKKHLIEHISVRRLEEEYQADRSIISRWVKKDIAEVERLRPMVAKLEIENERLKKAIGWKELVQ